MQATTYINPAYFFQKIYELLTGQYLPDWSSTASFLSNVIIFIRPISIFLSLLFLTGIIYSMIRVSAVMHEIMEKTHAHSESHGHAEAGSHGEGHVSAGGGAEATPNPRWEKIQEHINSTNSSDWRLAILECDIILDEMLTKMSYHGETLSDKLKAVEKSDFLTIDKAWEAHGVRNSIAHEGSNFQISDREAKRVVGLYEEIFKEFHYI